MLKSYLGKTMHISIEKSRLTLKQNRSWWQKKTTNNCQEIALENDALQFDQQTWLRHLNQLPQGNDLINMRCDIDVVDQFVRYFMVSPASNTQRLQDCKDVAQSRFQDLFDDDIRHWRIEADWHPEQPFIACALPRSLLDALNQFAKSHRLQVMSLKPNAITYCNQLGAVLNEGDWILNLKNNYLFLACVKQRRLNLLHTTWVPQRSEVYEHWLSQLCEQVSLRQDTAIGEKFFVNCELPSDWKLGFNTKIIVANSKINLQATAESAYEAV